MSLLYRRLWPVWFQHIFPQGLIKGTILGKKKYIVYKTRVLTFSTNTSEIFQQDTIINIHMSSSKVPSILVRS